MAKREAGRARQSSRDRNDASNDQAAQNGSMTVDEWCEYRRISRGLLYKLWRNGLGPRFHYIGEKRLISRAADEAYIAEREREATAEAASAA